MLNPDKTKQTESLQSIKTINTIETNPLNRISTNGKIGSKKESSKSFSVSKFKTIQEHYDLCRLNESNSKEYIIYYTIGHLIIRPMGFFYGTIIDEFSEITPYILRRSNGEINWIKFNSKNPAMLADHTYLYESITAPSKNNLTITIQPESKSIIQVYGEMYHGFSFRYPSTIDLKGKLFLVQKNSEDGFREEPIETNCNALVRYGTLVVFICDNRNIAIVSDSCQMVLKMEKSIIGSSLKIVEQQPSLQEGIDSKKKLDSLSDLKLLIKSIQLKLSQQKDEFEKPKANEFEQSPPQASLADISTVESIQPIEKFLPIEPQQITQPEKNSIKQFELKENHHKEIKESKEVSQESTISTKFGDDFIKKKDFKEIERKIKKKSKNKSSEITIKSLSSSLASKFDSSKKSSEQVKTILANKSSSFSKLKRKIERKSKLSAKAKVILSLLTKPSSTELIERKSASSSASLSSKKRIFKRKKIPFKKRPSKTQQNLKTLMRPPQHKDSIKKSRSLFAKSLISVSGSKTFSPSSISSEIIKRVALKNQIIEQITKSKGIDESSTDKQDKIKKTLSLKSDEFSESIQKSIEIFRNKLSKVKKTIESLNVDEETLYDQKIQEEIIKLIEDLIKTGRNVLTRLIRNKKLDRHIENQMDTDLKQLNKFKQDFVSLVKEKEKPERKIKSKETINDTLNCIESIHEIIKKI